MRCVVRRRSPKTGVWLYYAGPIDFRRMYWSADPGAAVMFRSPDAALGIARMSSHVGSEVVTETGGTIAMMPLPPPPVAPWYLRLWDWLHGR